jgi:hypothetical protein
LPKPHKWSDVHTEIHGTIKNNKNTTPEITFFEWYRRGLTPLLEFIVKKFSKCKYQIKRITHMFLAINQQEDEILFLPVE